MGGQQRVYRQRIASTESLQKIFRAMELIAASRIGMARRTAESAMPYTVAITNAVSAVASHIGMGVNHPLVTERDDTKRVTVVVLTADRGMAGAYNVSVEREAERLMAQLADEGKIVDLYVVGSRGVGYFNFRGREVTRSWTGESDNPSAELGTEIAKELLARFLASAQDGGVAEIHVVYTRFKNMVSQEPRVVRVLPLEVVEAEAKSDQPTYPLYEFEPSTDNVLDALLPRYLATRITSFLRQAAASELAARQRAMHTATENADDLIRNYTRLANAARQGEITQEITEIVSGANALSGS